LRKDVEKWLAAPENYLVEEFTAITPDKVMAEIQPTNFIRVFSPVGSFRLDPALVDDFFRSLNGDARRNATGVQISPEAIGAGMIRLGAVSTAVECIGYDDPGLLGVTDSPVLRSTLKDSGYLPAQLPGPGNSLNSGLLNSAAQLPLPRFRIRQTSAVGLVKEGETVLLGNFPVQQSMRPDPAGGPILGNLPRLGGYFSYSKYELAHRTLLIFVTPRIVPASP
jgi:hypothetical protein